MHAYFSVFVQTDWKNEKHDVLNPYACIHALNEWGERGGRKKKIRTWKMQDLVIQARANRPLAIAETVHFKHVINLQNKKNLTALGLPLFCSLRRDFILPRSLT